MSVFGPCEICGAQGWQTVYQGPVRDGAFGNSVDGAEVARCGGCGVERLAERSCPPESAYETEDYRRKLQQGLDTPSYLASHDELQIFSLTQLWPMSLRGQAIADIGCAGGSFLDHVSGLSSHIIAIEPSSIYHESLKRRGYAVYRYAADAARDFSGRIDLATSFQVIEHTPNPRQFLRDIRSLLKPDGLLVVSTPNRNDILNHLLKDDFRRFFYRVVHRWYFDADSATTCARLAGFEVVDVRHVHRYGMSNALAWLRDRSPTGQERLPGITPFADQVWRGFLEDSGQADTLYVFLKPAPDSPGSHT